jgi:hypothetical protein
MERRAAMLALFAITATVTALQPANGDPVGVKTENRVPVIVPTAPLLPYGNSPSVVHIPRFKFETDDNGTRERLNLVPCFTPTQRGQRTVDGCIKQEGGEKVYPAAVINEMVGELVSQINRELGTISSEQASQKAQVVDKITKVLSEELLKQIVDEATAKAKAQLFDELRAQGAITLQTPTR